MYLSTARRNTRISSLHQSKTWLVLFRLRHLLSSAYVLDWRCSYFWAMKPVKLAKLFYERYSHGTLMGFASFSGVLSWVGLQNQINLRVSACLYSRILLGVYSHCGICHVSSSGEEMNKGQLFSHMAESRICLGLELLYHWVTNVTSNF